MGRERSRSGEHVFRLAEIVDAIWAHSPEGQLLILGSSRTLWSISSPGFERSAQQAEVQDEQALGIDSALDGDPDPVVMAVERLALMARNVMKWAEANTGSPAHFDANLLCTVRSLWECHIL